MEKDAEIYCNLDFIEISTVTTCSMSYKDPLGDDFFFPLDEQLEVLGSALISALEKSRDLSSSPEEKKEFTENAPDILSGKFREWYDGYHQKWLNNKPERRLFEENLRRQRESEWLNNILKCYGYKNEKALYKNMQACSATEESEEIKFFSQGKDESSKGTSGFKIKSASPPEVIGAAVKYSVARCTGKGADLVAGKLFPDGVPDTFEDYLKSLNLPKA
ncbi:MAG: CdiI family contact-dependent growth inhibition immunity protein [Holosporaceae bacterium]|jgi:hypothetical protein|nr:CdiI family contact-dependent growth inhibition immunity protein [Holosporaceae bacterium]